MSSFTKFYQFSEDLAKGKHNLNSDTLKIMLTNSAPTTSNAVLGDLTEISTGNGYSAGGSTATFSTGAQTSGTYKLVLADVTFTASGGSIGAFRYAVLYNSTQTSPNKPLIGYWDYGAAITITDGNSFLVDLDGSAGVLQLA